MVTDKKKCQQKRMKTTTTKTTYTLMLASYVTSEWKNEKKKSCWHINYINDNFRHFTNCHLHTHTHTHTHSAITQCVIQNAYILFFYS